MTIIIAIIAVLFILFGVAYGVMGIIALGTNAEVSNKVRFIDFAPAIVLLTLGTGLIIWLF